VLHLAAHLLARYGHLTGAFVTVEQLRWERIGTTAAAVAGHPHAFWRDGAEKRFVEVELTHEGDGAVARVAAGTTIYGNRVQRNTRLRTGDEATSIEG
jgi:urate oxidase